MFLEICGRAISLEYLSDTFCCKFDIFLVRMLVFRIGHKYAMSIDCVYMTNYITIIIMTWIVVKHV